MEERVFESLFEEDVAKGGTTTTMQGWQRVKKAEGDNELREKYHASMRERCDLSGERESKTENGSTEGARLDPI